MNQNPEQVARDRIDDQLTACGWILQDKKSFNLAAGIGVAIREYQTNAGPADYLLFVNRKPVGLIEAKREEEGVRLTTVEDQSTEYATAKLKYINNDPLSFVYESTGEITRFTDYRDPKPRSRPVFLFHRPQTFETLLREMKTLRARVHDIPPLTSEGLRDCQVTAITNLEKSFRENRPKALIQMATGSGFILRKRKEAPVILPLVEEQKQIIQEIESRLSVFDKIEETIIDSLTQAEALDQSILKKAFEGELTN